MSNLKSMQRHASCWIMGAFKTSPTGGVETVAGLPPIKLHIKKLVYQSHVRICTLAQSHALHALVDGEGCGLMPSLSPADLQGFAHL